MEIKNLKKAASRILEAAASKEKIILYGDADMDGVASVIILKESLEILGNSPIRVYFPDREKEGYGINKSALKFLGKFAPALLITLDCGIGNVKEVDLAKKIGFEVIIIDHHEVLSQVPKASIIVNPKQKEDKYPFKGLACAGIVYKLSKLLLFLAEQKYHSEKFLELVLLATLYDKMPLREENEKFIKEGIISLNYTDRKGLKFLIKKTSFKNIGLEEIWQKIIFPLNAAGLENHLNEAYLLLIENNKSKAEKLVNFLIKKSEQKKIEIERIFKEVEERIQFKEKSPLIFEGNKDWSLVLLGSIVSRVCQIYKKPTFLFKKGKNDSPGTVRMPKGLDGVKAMTSCKDLLITYGGHAPAAGFRVKNKNLEKFKDCLIKYFEKQ